MTRSRDRSAPRLALLTSRGRGAVSVLKVWGAGAVETVSSVFRPMRPRPLSSQHLGIPRLGRIGEGLGDEAVAIVTGQDEVEIQGHAGTAAVESVIRVLVAAGANRVRPAEWAIRSTSSRFEAEAMHAISLAPTERTAEILLDQLRGALPREVERALADSEPLLPIIESWIERSKVGTRLTAGVRVVLAGRPNVGKSRLLNAIAGYERAIVSPIAGTTRDLVSVRCAVEGFPVEFLDTAGIRRSEDEIEAAGVARSETERKRADMVILVLDRSEPATDVDQDLLKTVPNAIIVANKSDLAPAWSAPGLAISAESGEGIEELLGRLSQRLGFGSIPEGAGVPFRGRHVGLLNVARSRLLEGDRGTALESLSKIVGKRERRRAIG